LNAYKYQLHDPTAFRCSRDTDLEEKTQVVFDKHGQPVWHLGVVKSDQIIRVIIDFGAVAF
jgi:hypothetical protein